MSISNNRNTLHATYDEKVHIGHFLTRVERLGEELGEEGVGGVFGGCYEVGYEGVALGTVYGYFAEGTLAVGVAY